MMATFLIRTRGLAGFSRYFMTCWLSPGQAAAAFEADTQSEDSLAQRQRWLMLTFAASRILA